MLTFIHTVAGEECRIFMPQRRDELGGLHEFLALGDKVLSIDTETTGLDIFSPGHELRLFQIGNRSEAWVLRPDLFADIIRDTLRCPSRYFVAHNAPYDLLVLDRHLGVTLEELGPRVFDTRILAHLLDPRQPSEGGAGLKLKPLSAIYVDPSAPDTQEGLTRVFNSLGYTKATGWRHIAIDHPTYVLYAGLDVILDRRLGRNRRRSRLRLRWRLAAEQTLEKAGSLLGHQAADRNASPASPSGVTPTTRTGTISPDAWPLTATGTNCAVRPIPSRSTSTSSISPTRAAQCAAKAASPASRNRFARARATALSTCGMRAAGVPGRGE